MWCSKDKKSWFKVSEAGSPWCFGELTFEEETLPVCYKFGHDDKVTIIMNDENQIYKDLKNGGYEAKQDAEWFYGSCTFKNNKVIINLHRKGEKHRETITLYKTIGKR